MDNPGLDEEPAYSRRYGKYSPVGVQCSNGCTRIEQMPEIIPGDIALLDNFYTDFDVGSLKDEQIERLKWLDKYLDLPTVQATLETTYDALSRCIHSNCIIPDKYRNKHNFYKFRPLEHIDIETSQWIISFYCIPEWKAGDIIKVIEIGNLEMLKIIHSNYSLITHKETNSFIRYAVEYNKLEILDWFYSLDRDYVLDIVKFTIVGGYNIKVIQWVHSKGVNVSSYCTTYHKNLDILKWMHSIGNTLPKNEIIDLVDNGNLDLLAGMHSAGILNVKCDSECNVGMVQHDCCIDPQRCNKLAYHAARRGNINILKWLFSNNLIQLHPMVMKAASREAKADVVKYLYSIGFDINTLLMNKIIGQAALIGDMPYIQWLYSIGGKLRNEDIRLAAREGHLDVLKWAYLKGTKWQTMRYAIKTDAHKHINEWLRKGASLSNPGA